MSTDAKRAGAAPYPVPIPHALRAVAAVLALPVVLLVTALFALAMGLAMTRGAEPASAEERAPQRTGPFWRRSLATARRRVSGTA